MYQKYTTDGFIVSTQGSREADRLYLLYTKEFGMILAHATSVRMSKSKLRPHLNSGVLLSFTLLKSKNRWKLLEVKSDELKLSLSTPEYKVFARILSVLKSLIHGEEKNESLWVSVLELFNFLIAPHSQEALQGAECLSMIKILASLGYGSKFVSKDYIERGFDNEVLLQIFNERKEIIQDINSSLKATGF